MSDPAREARYLQMTSQFPDSPLGFFSLGRYYLEERRWADAVKQLTTCTSIDGEYAAALLSLGDAHAGAGDEQAARAAYARARTAAMKQNHPTLAEEIDERVDAL